MPIDIHPRIMTFDYTADVIRVKKWFKKEDKEDNDDKKEYKEQLISSSAAELSEYIVQKRGGVLERSRPIVFVVHSLGDVVVEECLVQSKLRNSVLLEQTKALVFFSTPHKGSASATKGAALSQVASAMTFGLTTTGSYVKQLKPLSPSLQTLALHLQQLSPQFVVLNFVEELYMYRVSKASREENSTSPIEFLFNRLDCWSGIEIDGEPEGNGNVNTALKPVSHFFGRAQGLESIVKHFQYETGTDIQRKTVRLHSFRRKIGTSQIAAKFAAEHRKRYAATLWFDATSIAHFQVSRSTNANELGLIADNASRGQTALECNSIRAWLGRGDQIRNLYRRRYCWLVVLDNCRHSSADDFLSQILPDSPTVGSVLITTFEEDVFLGDVDDDNEYSSLESNVHPLSNLNGDGQDELNTNINNIHLVPDFIAIEWEASNSTSNGGSQDEETSESALNTNPFLTPNSDISMSPSPSLSASPFTSNSDDLLLLIEPFSNEAIIKFVATTLTAKNYQHPAFTDRDSIGIATWCDGNPALLYAAISRIVSLNWRPNEFTRGSLMDGITAASTSAIGELNDSAIVFSQIAACFGSAGMSWDLFVGASNKFYDYEDNAIHYTQAHDTGELVNSYSTKGIITPTPDGADRVHAAFQKEILSQMTIRVRKDRYGNWAIMLSEQGNYLDVEGINLQVLAISSNLVWESRLTRKARQFSDGNRTSSPISPTTLLLLHADLYSLLGTIAIKQNSGVLAVSRMEEVLKLREEALEMQRHGNARYIQQQKVHINLAVKNVAASYIIAEEPQRALDMLGRWNKKASLGRLQEAKEFIDRALASEASRFHVTNANIILRSPQPNIELVENDLNECLALRLKLIPKHSLTGLTYHKMGKLYQDHKRHREAASAPLSAVDLLRPACTASITYIPTPVLSYTSGIDPTAMPTPPTEISYGPRPMTSLPVTFLVRSLWAYSRALYFESQGQGAGKYQDEAYQLVNSNKITLPQPHGEKEDGSERSDLRLWELVLHGCDASYMNGSWNRWIQDSHR
ncbi:hypothetical protein IFR05_010851 [Cadophora sp. M221]|nr:hypothetical protein IFR05_010851 [Cadophora sp. M221]